MIRYVFGIWTMVVALSVSAVAAYYSIVGLTAIFAAAIIPVIIMGSVLEIAKITTAVWLHSFWHSAPLLMRSYLITATIVLILITSMGIFGFLSKAHIEQNANVTGLAAQIERIDQRILSHENSIERANTTIAHFEQQIEIIDSDVQSRIAVQERIIENIQSRLNADIVAQRQIIQQEQEDLTSLGRMLEDVESQRQRLDELLQSNDIRALQILVGATVDGVMGPGTRAQIAQFQADLDIERDRLINEIETMQQTESPRIEQARQEITSLREAARDEIAQAQQAISVFRDQLVSAVTTDNSDEISDLETQIAQNRAQVDQLDTERFGLERQLRTLEVEVGPVRYIAELAYGEADSEILEKAVRWVIIILVIVFDPLAIVLLLAGVSLLRPSGNNPESGSTEHPDKENLDVPLPEDNVEKTQPSDEPKSDNKRLPMDRVDTKQSGGSFLQLKRTTL